MRNAHDWLRVTALLAGEKEQYAKVMSDRSVTLLLKHDATRDDFQTIEHVEYPDGTYTLHVRAWGRDIAGARRTFKRRRQELANTLVPNRLETRERR